MYSYKVMYTWVDKLGNRYEYVTANNSSEAKRKVQAMYKDAVKVHWAEKQK